MKLSCTSVMLPRWDLDLTFDKLAEHGYDGVELRCRYNPEDDAEEPSFWGRHLSDVSPDNIIHKAEAIRAAQRRTGVQVIALAPNVTLEESEVVEKLFRGAATLNPDNPPMIRIGAPRHDRTQPYWPQFLNARAGFANLVETARQFNVKILYEIHVGTVAVTCSRTIELLRDLDPDRIGAIYDIPNMLRVGLEDTRWAWNCWVPISPIATSATASPSSPDATTPAHRSGSGTSPTCGKVSPTSPGSSVISKTSLFGVPFAGRLRARRRRCQGRRTGRVSSTAARSLIAKETTKKRDYETTKKRNYEETKLRRNETTKLQIDETTKRRNYERTKLRKNESPRIHHSPLASSFLRLFVFSYSRILVFSYSRMNETREKPVAEFNRRKRRIGASIDTGRSDSEDHQT